MCFPLKAESTFLKKAMRIKSKSVYWAETAQTEQYMAHDMHAKKGHKAEWEKKKLQGKCKHNGILKLAFLMQIRCQGLPA